MLLWPRSEGAFAVPSRRESKPLSMLPTAVAFRCGSNRFPAVLLKIADRKVRTMAVPFRGSTKSFFFFFGGAMHEEFAPSPVRVCVGPCPPPRACWTFFYHHRKEQKQIKHRGQINLQYYQPHYETFTFDASISSGWYSMSTVLVYVLL